MHLRLANVSAGLEASDKQGGMGDWTQGRKNLEAPTQIDGSWLWNADPNGRSSGRRTGLLKALSLFLQHWFLVLVFMIDCERYHVRDVTEISIY
jgi:hypothetical protein